MASSYDPFDTADIVNIPDFSYEDDTKWHGFCLDEELHSAVFSLPDVEQKDLQDFKPGAFTLDLEEVPLSSLETSSASSYTTAEENTSWDIEQANEHAARGLEDDVWTFAEAKESSRPLKLNSWDHFTKGQHEEPETAYLSEAGASTFDAIVSSSSANRPTRVIPDKLLQALYELGLGRSSILFQWNEDEHLFARKLDTITVSGCTPESAQLVINSTMAAGTIMRNLSRRGKYRQRSQRPSGLAFRSVLESSLMAIQQYMDDQRHDITTVLGLQHTYSSVLPVLEVLNQVATLVQEAESDHTLLASFIKSAADIELQYHRIRPVLDHLFSAIAHPMVEELSRGVGLTGHNHILSDETCLPEESELSAVLPKEIFEMVQQTARTLKLLRDDTSSSLGPVLPRATAPGFRLGSSWTSIIRLQADADDYERTAKSNILARGPDDEVEDKGCPQPSGIYPQPRAPESAHAFQFFDIESYPSRPNEVDPTSCVVLNCLTQSPPKTNLAPNYDEVITYSISPVLIAQHRLLSYSIFELLLNQHNLNAHLALQHRIQLFGDGIFATRLGIALFDSEQSSGEGRRRTGATAGLRLQTRDTWPPASSELRLVLMGVLSESMSTSKSKALEGAASFAIRELSDEELERCRDLDSIHALDFLKLHYRPSNPVLEAVISSESLEKYDKIFQHLLRVLRLKSVAQTLLREVSNRRASTMHAADHKFRIESQHFISALADYSQNVAVNRTWTSFETIIRRIQTKLESKDYDGVLSSGRSLESLKRKHEDALDSILRALLLKRKQKQALEVLEDIFGAILKYAAAVRKQTTDEETMRRCYDDFRNLRGRFVVLLQEMVQGQEMKEGNTDGSELFEELLLRLDFNGSWKGNG